MANRPGAQGSRRVSDAVQDLPGFDLKALVRKSDDIADLSEEKEYTAERLLVSHPERYEIARRLFFELGLSKRGVCDICRLNSRTLNALIEREFKTRGADFLYEKVRRKRALITYQLCEQLEDLAADPKACKEAGINGLVSAIRLIQDQSNRTIDVPTSSNTSGNSPVSDGVEYAKLYRLNGLDQEKKSARASEVIEVSNQPVKVNPAAHVPAADSILLSGVDVHPFAENVRIIPHFHSTCQYGNYTKIIHIILCACYGIMTA